LAEEFLKRHAELTRQTQAAA